MTEDWSGYLEKAENKSDHQLEIEAEKTNDIGGNAEIRAAARVEIKKRDRKAADQLAMRQLATAEQQARSAKSAVLAAWGSAAATVLACAISLWAAYRSR
jgi:hypothetical protein